MAAKKLADVDISSSYDSIIVNDNGAIRQVSKNDIIAPYNNLKNELDAEIEAERERIDNLISKTDNTDGMIDELKGDIGNLEALLRTIQEKLNSGSSSVDTVTVNEINDMIVEYFENKTVSEVEA